MRLEMSPRVARSLRRWKPIKLNPGESFRESFLRSLSREAGRLRLAKIEVGTGYERRDCDAGTGPGDKPHPWVVLWKDCFGVLWVPLNTRKACSYHEDEYAFFPVGLNGFVDPRVESVARFDLARITPVSGLMREDPQRLGCLQPETVNGISRAFLDSRRVPNEVRTDDIVDTMDRAMKERS